MTRKLLSTQIETPEGFIDLAIGQPGLSVLPMGVMRRAAQHRLAQEDRLLLNYGPDQGDGAFLQALANYLSRPYGFPVDPLSLMVTGGASQALNMLCTFFTQPGDTIFVEEPTYFTALLIFREHQLNIVSIPMDEHGLVVDALEEELNRHKPRFVYTIPAFQNPTGITLSLERRQRLVDLSLSHDFLIIADEVYQLLNFRDKLPPMPMAALIESDTVFSIGSFSKILAPGLRLGWIQAGPKLLDRLVDIKFIDSGGALNQFTSHIVRSVIELGLQEQYLKQLRHIYHERSTLLCQAIREHFGHVAHFREPDGGFFVWVELAPEIDMQALHIVAAQYDVGFLPGTNCSGQGQCNNFMRFSFAHYESDDLVKAAQRLEQALSS